MSRIYKLPELIEMAKSGKTFIASSSIGALNSTDILNPSNIYSQSQIMADWTVTFKKIIYHTVYHFTGELSNTRYDSIESASKAGKPVKFIEVIENE